jgi:hypothetical protein
VAASALHPYPSKLPHTFHCIYDSLAKLGGLAETRPDGYCATIFKIVLFAQSNLVRLLHCVHFERVHLSISLRLVELVIVSSDPVVFRPSSSIVASIALHSTSADGTLPTHGFNSPTRIDWTLRYYALLIPSRMFKPETTYATLSHPTPLISHIRCARSKPMILCTPF